MKQQHSYCKECVNDYTQCEHEPHPCQRFECEGRDPKSRYYGAGGIETLDIIKAKLTQEQYNGWLLGNIIKYSCRVNHKDQKARDVEKIIFYSIALKSEI